MYVSMHTLLCICIQKTDIKLAHTHTHTHTHTHIPKMHIALLWALHGQLHVTLIPLAGLMA